MKKTTTLIIILFSAALISFSCRGMIGKVPTSLVKVTVGSNHTAVLDIRPATLLERAELFLARNLSLPVASAAIPSIVQDLRLTVSATDMTTISATVNVVGLSSADFIVDVPNGLQRHFVVEGLDSGAAVQYKGEAYSDLIGDPILLTINMVTINTPDSLAPVFAGVTSATVVSSTDVALSWSPATDNVTSQANIVYLIYQATSPSGEIYTTPTYTTTAGATSYTVTGLTPGTTYYFVVRAQDEAGNIDSNTIERTNTTPDTIAPAFAGLSTVSKVTLSTMDLSWTPATDDVTPQGNIRYLIYRTTTPGGEVYTTPTDITSPGATTYTATGLITGTIYYFVVRAQDGAGNIDTNTVEFSGVYPTLFVNALTGTNTAGCGSPATPCLTITQALSLTAGTEAISVATGTYDTTLGETLPIQLKTGTPLLCNGPNHTTLIMAGSGDAIYGATGALIDGCRVIPGSDATAINDQAAPITINNVLIDEDLSGLGQVPWEAIILAADSTIANSTFVDTGSTYITVNGGNPVITNNTMPATINSPDGILVNAGNPMIKNNTFTGSVGSGFAIATQTGNPTIDGNTISWSLTSGAGGISISSGAPVITRNTITGNDTGISVGNGSPTINNNSITNGTIGMTIAGSGIVSVGSNTISDNSSTGINVPVGASPPTVNITGNWISTNSPGISLQTGTVAITGNTINNNSTAGISVFGSSTTPTINNNSLYCNNPFDLIVNNIAVATNAQSNSWDHDAGTSPTGPNMAFGGSTGPCSPGPGIDICYIGASPVPPDISSFLTAVPSPPACR